MLPIVLVALLSFNVGFVASDIDEDREPLYLLAMASSPDEQVTPGWAVGPVVIPAIRLAVDHINNRSDVLRDYNLKLLEADSGCTVTSTTIINFIREVFYSGERIVGIVDSSCSESTLALAPILAQPDVSLLQISLATSPTVGNSTRALDTTYSILNSLQLVSTLKELIKSRADKWNMDSQGVGAIYEAEGYWLETFEYFKSAVGEQRLNFSFGIVDSYMPLSETIQVGGPRIIFAFMSARLARRVLCLAYRLNPVRLTYPNYQWIFSGRRIIDFMENVTFHLNGTNYTCSQTEMQDAINRTILTVFKLDRDDQSTIDTVAKISYTDYLQQYYEYFLHYLNEIQLHRDDVANTTYFNPSYDATWAMALSLNNSTPLLEQEGLTLANYSYGHPNVTKIIQDQLLRLQFEGMSGRIAASETGLVTTVDIFQVVDGKMKNIGRYCNNTLTLSGNATFINQSTVLAAHMGFSIPLIIGSILLTAVVVLLQLINVFYSNYKTIKASSPQLNHIIFSGCYIFIAGALNLVILDTFPSSNPVLYGVQCSGFMWSLMLAFSLIFGTICGKIWRIYRIFSHFQAGPVTLVSDYLLIAFVMLLLLLDVIFNVTWNILNPWRLIVLYTLDQGVLIQRSTCVSDNFATYAITFLVYKGILLFLVFYLSILSRGVHKKEFKSGSINILIYCLVVLYTVNVPVIAVFMLRDGITAVYLVLIGSVLLFDGTVVLCVVFVFLPPIWPLLKQTLLKQSCIKSHTA